MIVHLILVKKIKPNFKTLGPRYGKIMKQIAAAVANFSQEDIATIERTGTYSMNIEGTDVQLLASDVEIIAEDIPGWVVANQDAITVALDVTITPELKYEGYARELVNRIQNFRKDSNLDVMYKIEIQIASNEHLNPAIEKFREHICNETLCKSLEILDHIDNDNKIAMDIDEQIVVDVFITKAE